MTMIDGDVTTAEGDLCDDKRWHEVDAGFWVGNGSGRFFGSVERRGDVYLARDMTSAFVGEYTTLEHAQEAIIENLDAKYPRSTHAADRRPARKPASLL